MTQIIRLSKAQPCEVRKGDGFCHRPALAAYAYPKNVETADNELLLQPICQECASEMAKLYRVD